MKPAYLSNAQAALRRGLRAKQQQLGGSVRLNIRPFVKADVLRAKVNVHWKKDRGKNPDGSERHNDLHYTVAEKQAARSEAGAG